MHQVMTTKLDESVLTCLQLTNDSFLLGKHFKFSNEAVALAEVIGYIEDVKNNEVTPSVLKLCDLCKLYTDRLE